MFDISPADVEQLNDVDLRELVARLCEAELTLHSLSPAAVTWGGAQTAADGGLDVKVDLPDGTLIDGFVPRGVTGFQVKTPDMPRAAILKEMRPAGVVRPSIEKLALAKGGYVIVSSQGSVAYSALEARRSAMREALNDVPGAEALHTDFYDRTRLASWVRCHAGVIAWVRAKIGRSVTGWQAYGAWSGAAESRDAEYLLDDKLRLHFGDSAASASCQLSDGIDRLREQLAQPGRIVRLVGLSGVGKTRLVQALFDSRVGNCALPQSWAIYTDLADDPSPQPIGLATDLMARRMRAILIVDNCPPELHARLAKLFSGPECSLSVITVEYDVREDQPERTRVVRLDTSSNELIEKLVKRRFGFLSAVDARSIAEASGGNARIAIALAETVEASESIAGLTSEELFERLFRQRHASNEALLDTAKALSLVYSFDGETLTGIEAELPRLATLADQTARQTYRYVAELHQRQLLQKRGLWRAVLPHAIANRLAARALTEIPYQTIAEQLLTDGAARLAQSFSRRLSYLHEQQAAVSIVKRWLAADGLLGDIAEFDSVHSAMFVNVAPVVPEATLGSLERLGQGDQDAARAMWHHYRRLLWSLAYDAELFERSVTLLVRVAVESTDHAAVKEASDTFESLFALYLSGTHATAEQRIAVIERLLSSREERAIDLGIAALNKMLKSIHFSSFESFDFGGRSRDFGYCPKNVADRDAWYSKALSVVDRYSRPEHKASTRIRSLLASNIRGLWMTGQSQTVEQLSQEIAKRGFWREGWIACRSFLTFPGDKLTGELKSGLQRLERQLAPTHLVDKVRAVVLGSGGSMLGIGEDELDIEFDAHEAITRMTDLARALGRAVAEDEKIFESLLPELILGGPRVFDFGLGLADGTLDLNTLWLRLVTSASDCSPAATNVPLARGVLASCWARDQALANQWLDDTVERSSMRDLLPALQITVGLDERGLRRLQRALSLGTAVAAFEPLAQSDSTRALDGLAFKELIESIATRHDGWTTALNVLHTRLFLDGYTNDAHDKNVLWTARELLANIKIQRWSERTNYEVIETIRHCLQGQEAAEVTSMVVSELKAAVAESRLYWLETSSLLTALLQAQPIAVLDTLFAVEPEVRPEVINHWVEGNTLPFDAVSTDDMLNWSEKDADQRFPIAAGLIKFDERLSDGSLGWTRTAKALLSRASDVRKVVAVFIERFRPTSWSGSYAAILEANSKLLESIDDLVPTDLIPFIVEAKAALTREIVDRRASETNEERARDERFE
ncbi:MULTISPECIES: hypothetical protein [Caballeronia]|uniref:hypothetical protein n=1 Tax=Caballeronia TaxID=1827195 RepID=UPI00025BAD70|nr:MULTISPECIES: hypothetical protein [Caballeronia]EKS70395.1 hypothetical protein BURK_020025 [Burkholderia sp. SJ98]MCE4546329.1 hypothetical protein [Caballeronia sp. PC1]MCE4573196.1 hypothetical protein [Caballeronia sp. CLC5]